MTGKDTKRIIGEALRDIVESAKSGGPRIRVGLMATGSELGPEELARGAVAAREARPGLEVVMIGPKIDGYDQLQWIETPDCEEDISRAMESALKEGDVSAAVALHYPFPLGVTTIGRVVTPARGRPMFIASTTGTSATERIEAMVRNAVYGVATARSIGMSDPTVGILNIDGAQTAFRALLKLRDNGFPLSFGSSVRKDGGAILRGNDILAGAVDVCVTDTLTGNVLIKMFSAFTTGGGYEATGWGYGPSVGGGWPFIVSIISRASGAPVISGALQFSAAAAAGGLPEKIAEHLALADKAGLTEILSGLRPSRTREEAEVSMPPSEPTEDEIHGIDVLSIEDAVRALWKRGIYAESAMGCTGPVVKVPGRVLAEAEEALRSEGFI
ncbi:MAG TPA: glycine/sarcosine/betaine reductase complex component C subunit alpha [Synergistales bacterium]|nr:glycine reductase [Synergistaceae bacterium]HQO82870.1 glycine/sarcosine/betaine reductase complex component C subunit alpha [Synergistales bacterium]HQQ10019.1 glycine/sarcosine/betaine reductase complex component C subunit alpha [Synergistales bacterium]